MLSAVITIFKKELVDALRDRKALMTILISPVLTLAIIYGGSHFAVFMQQDSQAITLHVQGADNAEPLIAWLNERGITTEDAGDDAVERVRDHEIELLLVIPDELPEDIASFKVAEIELVYDQSRKNLTGKIVNIKLAVQQWSSSIGALRLVARGVSPQVMTPLQLVDTDVSESKTGAVILFAMVALILTMNVFTSSIGVAVDMMAGEREKRSLEPLLLNPVSRINLLLGKWLTAIIITLGVLLLINVSLYLIIPQLPLDQLGLKTQLPFLDIIYLTLIAMPLILFATIIQLFVSIFSKSFKEAQSYIGLLVIIPVFIGYYVIWSDVATPWQYWVPVMSTQNLMEDVLSKGYSDVVNYIGNLVVTLGLSLVLVFATGVQLKREKIIYG